MPLDHRWLNDVLFLWRADEQNVAKIGRAAFHLAIAREDEESVAKIKRVASDFALARRQILMVAIALNSENAEEFKKGMKVLKEEYINYPEEVRTSFISSIMGWRLDNRAHQSYGSVFSIFEFISKNSFTNDEVIGLKEHSNQFACSILVDTEECWKNELTNGDDNTISLLPTEYAKHRRSKLGYDYRKGLTSLVGAIPGLQIYNVYENDRQEALIRNGGSEVNERKIGSALIVFGELKVNLIKIAQLFEQFRIDRNLEKGFNLSRLLVFHENIEVLKAHLEGEAERLGSTVESLVNSDRLLFYAIVSGDLKMLKFIYELDRNHEQYITIFDENKKEFVLTPLAFIAFLLNHFSENMRSVLGENQFIIFKQNAKKMMLYFTQLGATCNFDDLPFRIHAELLNNVQGSSKKNENEIADQDGESLQRAILRAKNLESNNAVLISISSTLFDENKALKEELQKLKTKQPTNQKKSNKPRRCKSLFRR